MKRLTNLLLIAMTLTAATVFADDSSTSTASPNSPAIGDATKSWLELQHSGKQSSEHPQQIQGPVMQRSYERYLKSFERPIPERFDRYEKK